MSSQVPPPGEPEGSEPRDDRAWDDGAWTDTPSAYEQRSEAGGWAGDYPVGPPPASVGKRIGAYVIDQIGIGIVGALVLIPIGFASAISGTDLGAGGFSYLGNLVLSAIVLAYFVFTEANGGQTVAKKLLGIRAVMANGSPVDLQAAFKRNFWWVLGNVIPVVGWLVGLGIIIYALITTTQDQPLHRGFHDRFADTMVVEAS